MPGSNDIVSSAGGTVVIRARRTTDQTGLTSAVRSNLVFNLEDWDLENCWNGTTYTVPVTGFYEFALACRVSATGTLSGSSELQLFVKVDTTVYTLQRIVTNPAIPVQIASGVYYAPLTQGQLVNFQAMGVFTGATAIKLDGAILPIIAIIRRH